MGPYVGNSTIAYKLFCRFILSSENVIAKYLALTMRQL